MDVLSNNSAKNKHIRIGCLILGLLVIFFVLVWTRAYYGSRKAHNQAEDFLKRQQAIRAITYFDRSIHWYTPLNPYVQKSATRLWEMGNKAEQEGDIKLALIAYRTIRQGFLSASSFFVPGKSWIFKCESKIKALEAFQKKKKGLDLDDNSPKHLIIESQDVESPVIFWSIIVEIGFLGWIGSVIGLIMFALKRKGAGKLLSSLSLPWAGLALVFFALWIVGLFKA
jgi:hypothetical protein